MQYRYPSKNGPVILIQDDHRYFEEAVKNLSVDSRRSCIGQIYNAVFSDVMRKLKNFTEVNRTYSKVYTDALFFKNQKKPFEKGLVDALSSIDFLTEEQVAFLEEVRELRNDGSHPIGWEPSRAKTVYVVDEAVRLFLSECSLSPTTIRKEIVGRLSGTNYFPKEARSSVVNIVRAEVRLVIPAAYHLFVKDIKELWDCGNAIARSNCGLFLAEAITLDNLALRRAIIAMFLAPLLGNHDTESSRLIAFMVRLKPQLTRDLDRAATDRLVSMLRRYLAEEGHDQASQLLVGLQKRGPEILDGQLRPILDVLIGPNTLNVRLPDYLGRPGPAKVELLRQYRDMALDETSRDKTIAFLDTHAKRIADKLTGEECYPLLVAITGTNAADVTHSKGIVAALTPKVMAWQESRQTEGSMLARREVFWAIEGNRQAA